MIGFREYLIYYPEEDETDYDGVHSGGIKGICDDAPDEVKKEFEKFLNNQKVAKKKGLRIL